jgi:hypothetical protein
MQALQRRLCQSKDPNARIHETKLAKLPEMQQMLKKQNDLTHARMNVLKKCLMFKALLFSSTNKLILVD